MDDAVTQLEGVFPILATCFHDDQSIDFESQRSLVEYCIESGAHGLVTLANASEGHLLSDREKRELVAACIKSIDGRVPLIVAVNHPSTKVACEMAGSAESAGAAAVMALPPFFGRWRSSLGEIESFFSAMATAVEIPVVLQDHALADISLSADYLARISNDIGNLSYLKLESANIINKTEKIRNSDHNYTEIFGGNSGILFVEEYDAGCRGTMPACYMPHVFRKVWDLVEQGERDAAVDFFAPYSRLAMFENEAVNRCVWKEVLRVKGVIKSGRTRAPVNPSSQKSQIDSFLTYAARLGIS